MILKKALTIGLVVALGAGLSACSSIRESRGYVVDGILINSVQPGIDNLRSVEATLGRPTFTSQYGEKTWYYVSSVTEICSAILVRLARVGPQVAPAGLNTA